MTEEIKLTNRWSLMCFCVQISAAPQSFGTQTWTFVCRVHHASSTQRPRPATHVRRWLRPRHSCGILFFQSISASCCFCVVNRQIRGGDTWCVETGGHHQLLSAGRGAGRRGVDYRGHGASTQVTQTASTWWDSLSWQFLSLNHKWWLRLKRVLISPNKNCNPLLLVNINTILNEILKGHVINLFCNLG